jgi:uncharacterized protein with ATP-grasp and redox domains
VADLLHKYCDIPYDRFREEKQQSNAFALERVPQMEQMVAAAEDPVYTALQLAILGNYIDFGALYGKVSFQELEKLLEQAKDIPLPQDSYQQFRKDLQNAEKFLLITDNAGEIVFDRILAETLQKIYPRLSITFMVRGGPAHNDATREDAEAVQIPFKVIDSGKAIGGTPLTDISDEAKAAIADADVILAKGMGNTESMYGCGYPVYYAFLIKCVRFQEYFKAPLMSPMFIKDPQYA